MLGFLASHTGTNMQAIIDAIKEGRLDAKACAVISNNSNSVALERARNEGIPAYHISSKKYPDEQDLDNAIINALKENGVDTVILAGYMKKLSPRVIQAFKGRVLNIHPALLPKFGGKGLYGMYVHEAVIEAGEKVSGATVHLVDEHYDHGRILNQRTVEVAPDDTPETLAQKVLKIEHQLYVETLQKIASGEIQI